MTDEKLEASWRRTTGFLLDCRAHFSEAAEGVCEDELNSFKEYLDANELELALDMLEEAYRKSPYETQRVLELMVASAESMELSDRAVKLKEELANRKGGA